MKKDNPFFLNNNPDTQKRKTLNYLAFIKFFAMIMIIKWHIYIWPKRPIDYGARMCEILFISSGFLVGYNYYNKNINCDYKESFAYTYKHLRIFYPLLFIITIYGFFISPRKKNIFIEYEIFISTLLLITSWSSKWIQLTFFTAHTWFLSSLIICYFFTPLLLKGIKNIKISIFFFIVISFIRISIEEIIKRASINIMEVDFHVGPIIRLLEFYMGMLLNPTFFFFKKYLDKLRNNTFFKAIFTIVQIFWPIIIYYIMLKYNDILYRCYFVLIFCISIFIASYDYGYLSALYANKIISKIMSCQMEMYLLHMPVNKTINKLINKRKYELIFRIEIQFLIKLFIIFILGFFYKLSLRNKFAKLLDNTILIFKMFS